MEAAALIISLVALAAGGFGIWFQWGMFQASTNQLTEARTVLAKLEGVSLQLRETQQEQFGTVLDALIRREAVTEAGEQATTAEDRLKRLEARLAEQPEVSTELGELRTALDGVRNKLRELELQPATRVPSLGPSLGANLTASDIAEQLATTPAAADAFESLLKRIRRQYVEPRVGEPTLGGRQQREPRGEPTLGGQQDGR